MLIVSMMAVMFLPRQFHVLVVQNPHERDVPPCRGRSRSTSSSSTSSSCPSRSPGSGASRAGAQADSFILRLPLSVRQPGAVDRGVPRRLLRGHRDDRGRLARAVEDDHQRRHPPDPAPLGAEDIYWVTLFYTRLAHAGGVALGYGWASLAAGQLPAGRDGAAVVRRGDPVRAGHPARARTGGAATGAAPSRASRPASSCGSTR